MNSSDYIGYNNTIFSFCPQLVMCGEKYFYQHLYSRFTTIYYDFLHLLKALICWYLSVKGKDYSVCNICCLQKQIVKSSQLFFVYTVT